MTLYCCGGLTTATALCVKDYWQYMAAERSAIREGAAGGVVGDFTRTKAKELLTAMATAKYRCSRVLLTIAQLC